MASQPTMKGGPTCIPVEGPTLMPEMEKNSISRSILISLQFRFSQKIYDIFQVKQTQSKKHDSNNLQHPYVSKFK